MIYRIYSIRDNKIGHFGVPYFSHNEVSASRNLQMMCNDRNVQISHFPEDFDLHLVGSFDDESGVITKEKNGPKFILGAISFKKMEEKKNEKT